VHGARVGGRKLAKLAAINLRSIAFIVPGHFERAIDRDRGDAIGDALRDEWRQRGRRALWCGAR
jgi:hypothetical protein